MSNRTLFAALFLAAAPALAGNLLTNPGWDAQAAAVTLGDGQAKTSAPPPPLPDRR